MYKVIIVDDSKMDIDGLIKHIDWEKCECKVVGTAFNGLEGIEKAKELKPDIVITDISMPLIDGVELTKRINEMFSDVRYIYISCFDDPEFLKSAVDNNVSAYIYKPIDIGVFNEALLKVVSGLKEKKRTVELDSALKEQISLNKAYLTEKFFNEIIATGGVNEKIFNMLDLSVEKEYYFVLVQLDDFENRQLDEIYVNHSDMMNALKEAFAVEENHVIAYDWSKVILLISCENTDIDEIMIKIEGVQDSFQETAEFTFSAYVVPEICKLKNINNIFSKVRDIIQQHYFQQRNQIIMIDSGFNMISFKPKEEFSSLVKKINDYIFTEDYDGIREWIDYHIDESLNCDISYIKSLCFYLISALNIVLIERNKKLSDVFGDEAMIWEKLTKLNTNMNIKQWLINIFNLTAENLNDEANSDKYEYLANKMKIFIDENYTHPNISDEISTEFHITFDYANKIFKKYFNQTIIKYAINRKMEYAMVLLSTTNKKITEIAEELGYSSNMYFSVAFKKHTGMSPKAFRLNNLK